MRERAELARPVTFLSFAWNYSQGGLNPFGYHLFNLLLHLANGVLLFFFVRAMLSRSGFPEGNLLPLAAALIFAVHPAHTDVVSYVSNRSDALACLFYLLGLLFFIRSVESSPVWFAAVPACYALSFFSKQVGITLPVTVLLFDFLFIAQGRIGDLRRRAAFHGTLWTMALAFFGFQKLYAAQLGVWVDQALQRWTPANYLGIQPYVLARYLELWAFPYRLSIDHALMPDSVPLWKTAAALAGWGVFFWIIGKAVRPEFRRPAWFSAAWFFIASLPTSVFPLSDALADRRLYLPGAGLAVIVPLLALFRTGPEESAAALDDRGWWDRFRRVWVCLAVFAVCLAGAVWGRNLKFNAPQLLWEDAAALYPRSARIWNNLGLAQYAAGKTEEAEVSFRKAVELDVHQSESYLNLGKIRADRGDREGALRCYEAAMSVDPLNPKAYNNAGSLFARTDFKRAEAYYAKAIELNPELGASYNNRGLLLAGAGRFAEADADFAKAAEVQPEDAEAWYNRGVAAYQRGLFTESAEYNRRAAEIDPGSVQAHFNRGAALYRSGDFPGALECLETALSLSPGNPQILKQIDFVKSRAAADGKR